MWKTNKNYEKFDFFEDGAPDLEFDYETMCIPLMLLKKSDVSVRASGVKIRLN